MKKIVFLLLMLVSGISAFAQNPKNINVNTTYFDYKYRMIAPIVPQDPLFFNYGVSLESNSEVRNIYDDATLIDKLTIDGQNKIAEFTEDDYILSVRPGNLEITSSQQGKGMGDNYFMTIQYKFKPVVKLTKGNTDLSSYKYNAIVSMLDQIETYNTKNFKTAKEANDYWTNNRELIRNEIIKKELDKMIEGIRAFASSHYGFYIASNRLPEPLKTINTKDHPENDALQENVERLKFLLGQLDGTSPLSEETLAPHIDYFKGLIELYTTDSKADIKLRYIAFFNLCQTYMLLDRPDQTIIWADRLIANDQSPRDGEKFKEEAEELIDLFLNSSFKTRQFETAQYHTQF
jgi:hypothetical protein